MTHVRPSLLLLTLFGGYGCSTPPQPQAAPPAVAVQRSKPTVPGGPLRAPCRLGELSPDVPRVPLRAVLKDPKPFYGELVVVRGYFMLVFENISLLEPVLRLSPNGTGQRYRLHTRWHGQLDRAGDSLAGLLAGA
jgi:hypothetical protein